MGWVGAMICHEILRWIFPITSDTPWSWSSTKLHGWLLTYIIYDLWYINIIIYGLLLAGNWIVQMSTMNGRLFNISRFWACCFSFHGSRIRVWWSGWFRGGLVESWSRYSSQATWANLPVRLQLEWQPPKCRSWAIGVSVVVSWLCGCFLHFGCFKRSLGIESYL